MRRLYATPCKQDKDYGRFARYYLAHCDQFDNQYSFHDALAHLIVSLRTSQFMLYDDEDGNLQAYMQYRYEEGDNTVFIDSTIISPAYRSSRVFYRGFADWARNVMEEQHGIRQVRFHVRADHSYLNRLYAKFAERISERKASAAQNMCTRQHSTSCCGI